MKQAIFNISGQNESYVIEGKTAFGPDRVLLESDDNLIADTAWSKDGYVVCDFLDAKMTGVLKEGIRSLMKVLFQPLVRKDLGDFQLVDYHKVIDTDDLHKQVIPKLREGFSLEKFPIPLKILEARVSEVCGVELTCINPFLPFQAFYVRVVRPGKPDNNPPHRDVWLDYYRHCVNIFVPIGGSNELSALPLVPGSHLWKESEIERTLDGAKTKGFNYRVPSVTDATRPLEFIRPNPRDGQFMLFSPYLIHGGGSNLNTNTTRMSLEMRFFRRS